MATAEERVANIQYQKLSRLVRAGEVDMENALRQKVLIGSAGHPNAKKMMKAYKKAAENAFKVAFNLWDAPGPVKKRIIRAIKKARKEYYEQYLPLKATTPIDPSHPTLRFPDSRADYRKLIYDLENAEVKAYQPKSGWLKKTIIGTLIAGTLGFFGYAGYKAATSNKGKEGAPREDSIVKKVDSPEKKGHIVQGEKTKTSSAWNDVKAGLKATLGKGGQLLDGTLGMTPEEVEALRRQKVATKALEEQEKQSKIRAKIAAHQADQAAEDRNAMGEAIGTVVDVFRGTNQTVRETQRTIEGLTNRRDSHHKPPRPRPNRRPGR